jgi:hypothetical protein
VCWWWNCAARDDLGELLQVLGIYGSLYDAEGRGPFVPDDQGDQGVRFIALYKKKYAHLSLLWRLRCTGR